LFNYEIKKATLINFCFQQPENIAKNTDHPY
jgi:hypothetical protein